jgi:hypothetical protein
VATTDWVSQNVGTILTVGGSIVVAVITVAGAAWAKNHTPKQPVPIQDVWGENRTLRTELREVRDAFDALFDWAERAIRLWGASVSVPLFTKSERDTISKVRRLPLETDDESKT